MSTVPEERTLNPDGFDLLEREALIKSLRSLTGGGVAVTFHGKRSAMEIAKRIRPRITRVVKSLCIGTPEQQAKNLIIEGENLQAMVTLYKYRGRVDLIVTDPPYNTGHQFRYNDRWDITNSNHDPNDDDLGTIVSLADGSRHTKWMKAIMPRLQMMKAMLRPSGVLAICIDHNELFHLGMMLDEIFGEENRIGIINWQKAHSPKNDSTHLSTATEYVLVYANNKDMAKTNLLPRNDIDKKTNPDGDSRERWIASDPTARQHRKSTAYAVQSPFTGHLHYPNGEFAFSGPLPEARSHWIGLKKEEMRILLEEWGSKYEYRDIGDGRGDALVIAGSNTTLKGYDPSTDKAIMRAKQRANDRRNKGTWPRLYFRDDQQRNPSFGRPRMKTYLSELQQGIVPLTYWADEDYESPMNLGSQSWGHEQSGHSDGAKKELDAILGPGHGFQTVKPLRLIMKIIQLWCPNAGLVLDPYAGSGTTGHAVLQLNQATLAERKFILIEQGSPENGDKYARSLTQLRLRNVIEGLRPAGEGRYKQIEDSIPGGFEFRALTTKIDAKTVLSMRRDELIDVITSSHWDSDRNDSSNIVRIEGKYRYLIGMNGDREGIFIIWDGNGPVGQLDLQSYKQVIADAAAADLRPPYNVYARYEVYQSNRVRFYKIPDKILAHLGLNENSEKYNEDGEVTQ